ncbi:glycosyltransferase [Pseudomonas fluorescens group sp. PF-69]
MDKKYNFTYEPVSVYACAVNLVRKFSRAGAIHVDLGCGYAAIAREIEAGGARYIGFDANSQSVDTLKGNGIEAYELDLTDQASVILQLKTLCDGYQVVTISMLDVIEHLSYDCQLLSRIKESFNSEQEIALILSVPNSSHIDVSVKLLAGDFDYLDTGLLDKTHTVVYTEKNLAEVTQRNGWKQVAVDDYYLEFSEQFFEHPSIVLNRDSGIGRDFRRLKGILDPNCDVYQFVRAYIPDDNISKKQLGFSEMKGVSVSLVFPEDVDTVETLNLVRRLLDLESQSKIELILPETALGIVEGPFKVSNYCAGQLESFVAGSLGTRYWSYVSNPEEVCTFALSKFIEQFDCSRGTPLVELTGTGIPEVTENQFDLFSSVATNTTWRVMVPSGYASQFHDGHFASVEERNAFIRRASLACGISRFNVVFSTEQLCAVPPLESLIALKTILSDPTLQSYVLRSDIMVNAVHVQMEKIDKLQADLDEVLSSKWWRITLPLRSIVRQATRLTNVARAILRRDKVLLKGYARALYLRVSFLRTIWSFYTYKRMKFIRAIQDKTFSSDNIQSLNDLSGNRFSGSVHANSHSTLVAFPEIDISVVSYNSSRWVEGFLESLARQQYPLSKIHFKVVDHGSVDNTVYLFQQYISEQGNRFASAEVIQQGNYGFGAGHDRAIRAGKSDFCLIANLDLEFLPDSILKAITAAVNDAGTSAASWEFRQLPYEHPKYYDPVTLETSWSSHACVLLRREAYVQCGGYDHAIFMYGEDVELSYRLRSFGYTLKYLPRATVLHHTYEQAGEVKPLQFAGSVLGNSYIRLRYGSASDRFMAFALYSILFVYRSQFRGSKRMLLKNIPKLLKNAPHFLKGKGPASAKFPFRGFDYELIREGAFWRAEPFSPSRVMPQVTVIMRTYQGRGMFLKQAMQSVFNQTYPNIELLVAEDGGNAQQHLVESATMLAPSTVSVRFLANEKIGRSGVGNAAMAIANGQYYMFLDDDDLLFSDHIETLMQCLVSEPSLDAAYSLAFEVATEVNEDKSFYVEKVFYTPPIFRQAWDYSVLQHHNFIPIQSIIFKKELYQRWGGFDLNLDQLEDWNLWLRYGYEANFRYVDKTTSIFRTPATSNVRADRHALLHRAYNLAAQSANARIAKVVKCDK